MHTTPTGSEEEAEEKEQKKEEQKVQDAAIRENNKKYVPLYSKIYKKVKLNDPIRGGSKKFYVYVKDGDKIKKVSFGDTTGLSIKRDNPARRKSFRARHNCDSPGPRHKARYWSCRKW